MYVKTTTRKAKSGPIRYLHLAHNEWDPAKGRSVPKVLYSFGREDRLDKDAIQRLVSSLTRLLGPGATADTQLAFAGSRPYGGAYVLDRVWHRLGIAKTLAGLGSAGRGRPRDAATAERVLFGLVANRALAPASKLAASEWMSRDVHIGGLGDVSGDACYRVMDWLHEVRGSLEEQVRAAVAGPLRLEVDVLFFDTTSTYAETAAGHAHGTRKALRHSVVGLAVTREGVPVRVWCRPGRTIGPALLHQVVSELRDWRLGKLVVAGDAATRAHLVAPERAELPAEDAGLACERLLELERGWRAMQTVLEPRPVYHRLDARIHADVVLCWLALLLVRVAENTAGDAWPRMRRELDGIHIATFTGPAGTFQQVTDPSADARDLLARLGAETPRRIHRLSTPET